MSLRTSATPSGDVLAPLDAAQVVSLLTLDGRTLRLGYQCAALAPHHVLHQVWRGRLRGQLLEADVRTWHGARGKHRQQVGEPRRGLQLTIHVERALSQSSRQRLCHEFGDFTDSDLDLATLAGNLLAYYAPADPALPLFLHVHQNWRKGWAPNQVVELERDPALARRLIDHLTSSFRWNLDEQPDHLAPAQAPRPAPSATQLPHPAAAGDEAALPAPGQRGYYAQYAPVRSLFDEAA